MHVHLFKHYRLTFDSPCESNVIAIVADSPQQTAATS
jgi:hypothetical protein